MTEPTNQAQSAKGEPPIIRGYTREGQSRAELTLWFNSPKEGQQLNENAPAFTGVVMAGDKKVYVSAWPYAGGVSTKPETEGKEYPPFLSVVASVKDASAPNGYRNENLGTVQAMLRTTVDGTKIDVDGSRGLKFIGELKGQTVLPEGLTVTGNLNARFPDKATVLDLADQMGFSKQAVAGFDAHIEEQRKPRQQAAARP